MSRYRNDLPQLSGDYFLVDAGMETDLIFNHGINIPEFASHTLLPNDLTRKKMQTYFKEFLELANIFEVGFIMDAPTWKAHSHWKNDLQCTDEDLIKANKDAVRMISELRESAKNSKPVVLNGITGPCGDAYMPESIISVEQAEKYHHGQLSWLADTDVDMVSALTFTQSTEAAGYARAAAALGLPSVISFTVETDGQLPSGQSIKDAIQFVDDNSAEAPAYFMINCAHPDHFSDELENADWSKRIKGLRCNASRLSHAELDACEELDDGDPRELGIQYKQLVEKLPWINVFGGCCGSDLRHVREIAQAIVADVSLT